MTWPASPSTPDTYDVVITDSTTGQTRTISVPGTKTAITVGQLTPNTQHTATVQPIKDGVKGTASLSDPFTTLAKGTFFLAFLQLSLYVSLRDYCISLKCGQDNTTKY